MSEYAKNIQTIEDMWKKRIELSEIVRCRDCEFEMNGYCSRPDEWDDDLWFPVEPDGFCAWGERQEP